MHPLRGIPERKVKVIQKNLLTYTKKYDILIYKLLSNNLIYIKLISIKLINNILTYIYNYDIIIFKLLRYKLILIPILVSIYLIIDTNPIDSSTITYKDKIYIFIKFNSSLTTEKAKYLADRFISHGGVEGAKWLAATAKVESDFNSSAVGKAGEVSMFQIMRWPSGKDPTNLDHAIQEALKVRKEKLAIWDNQFKAIQAYNGNPKLKKTKLYANKIETYMRYM